MGYVFQVLLRITGRRRLDFTHLFELMFEDSWIFSVVLLIWVFDNSYIVVLRKCDIEFYVILKMKILFENLRCYINYRQVPYVLLFVDFWVCLPSTVVWNFDA